MDRKTKEQAFELATELQKRRAEDPLLNYQLHPKQSAFTESVLKRLKPENWFLAANRGGKSQAGAYCGAHLARFGNPGAKWITGASGISVRDRATSGWVSCLDFPTSRDVMQPKYFDNGFVSPGEAPPFIPEREILEWRVADQILKLKNGSIIGFKSADSGRRKYQGTGKDWFHMDEEHPWEIYEEGVIRVGSRPLLFFCTATILPPEGQQATGPSWVWEKIVSPYQKGLAPFRQIFGASIYDNPGILRSEIKRLESIYPEGSLSRRIRLGGELLPGIGGTRAYASFDRMLHVRPQAEYWQSRRPIAWIWDFNVEPLVSLVGQFDGKVYRIIKELVLDEGSIPEMCQYFHDSFPDHDAEIWVYGDATAKRRTGQTGKSDYYIIQQECKSFARIKMRVPEENPRVPDRVNSVNRLCLDEEGHVKFQVDPTCGELISDLEGVLRDGRGGIMKTHNRKDPYFRRTHTSDALGYWTAYEAPVKPPNRGENATVAIASPGYGFNG